MKQWGTLRSSRNSTRSSGGTKGATKKAPTRKSVTLQAKEVTFTYDYGPKTVEETIKRLLEQLKLEGEHFDETPRRVAAFLQSFNQPHDLPGILKAGFEETKDNIMVV